MFYPVFLRILIFYCLHLSTIDEQKMFCNLHPVLIEICQDYALAQLSGNSRLNLTAQLKYFLVQKSEFFLIQMEKSCSILVTLLSLDYFISMMQNTQIILLIQLRCILLAISSRNSLSSWGLESIAMWSASFISRTSVAPMFSTSQCWKLVRNALS